MYLVYKLCSPWLEEIKESISLMKYKWDQKLAVILFKHTVIF